MIIDGKQIASEILIDLKERVEKLKEKNILPHLYIILLSDDQASASYVNQKIKRGEELGIKITLDKENPQIKTEELINKINNLNNDKTVNGIIVQRPMPKHLNEEEIAKAIIPIKDVDGFNPNSNFIVPVAKAVTKIISNTPNETNFESYIKSKKIAVLGKGITAGQPIINYLNKINSQVFVIDSKTENKTQILKSCDLIISAVGKKDVITKEEIAKGAILIGVGLHKEDDGKFHGDFNEQEVSSVVSFYTPTPGGVGPVNVACLMENLVEATEQQNQ